MDTSNGDQLYHISKKPDPTYLEDIESNKQQKELVAKVLGDAEARLAILDKMGLRPGVDGAGGGALHQ